MQMDTDSSECHFGPPEDFSEAFFRIVARSVEFGGFAQDDTELRDRVVRLTTRGRSAEAISLVRKSSGLGEGEAQGLIKQVEFAADRVFYATGLRPSIRPQAGEETDNSGVEAQ
jgi:hypothetical protein